jgi:uncharacterized membrane protein YozB (DUF420 family)
MINADDLPGVNAILNTISLVLLILGFTAIRSGRITIHKACMLMALVVSAVFLASYLYLHIVVRNGKATEFQQKVPSAPDWVRITYYGILTSHIILAILTAPLALYTAYLGLKNRLAKHVWIARFTLPIWLYVSITGVVVYWMLYRL